MAYNKVIYKGETLIDLTQDTVTAETLAVGATAHGKDGEIIEGTFEGNGSSAPCVVTFQEGDGTDGNGMLLVTFSGLDREGKQSIRTVIFGSAGMPTTLEIFPETLIYIESPSNYGSTYSTISGNEAVYFQSNASVVASTSWFPVIKSGYSTATITLS